MENLIENNLKKIRKHLKCIYLNTVPKNFKHKKKSGNLI